MSMLQRFPRSVLPWCSSKWRPDSRLQILLIRSNSAIKTIPGQTELPLLHLRRFAKADFVPEQVRALTSIVSSCNMNNLQYEMPTAEEPVAKQECEETMHVLLCPTEIISHADICALIARTLEGFRTVKVVSTPVPLHAPTSLKQAAAKSAVYWPTVFLNGNPFGPHPSLVSRAQLELETSAVEMMGLARAVGRECYTQSFGCGAGVVVTERTEQGKSVEVVAVAGDGRWIKGMGKDDSTGSPGGHAVMRAIALVAKKRRQLVMSKRFDENGRKDVFAGEPLTPLELHHFESGKLVPNGYLCLNLEFWVTHEPCAMCCMAMLHSRAGRIVYGRRMPKTGAMKVNSPPSQQRLPVGKETLGEHPDHINLPTPPGTKVMAGNRRSPGSKRLDAGEDGLDYGLFWRDDLNWRFLCWQWSGEESHEHASEEDLPIRAETQI